jgi:hypothetical protein
MLPDGQEGQPGDNASAASQNASHHEPRPSTCGSGFNDYVIASDLCATATKFARSPGNGCMSEKE